MGSLRPTCRPGKLRTREYSLSLELTTNEPCYSDTDRMSYYRYITGLYKSYWPELNRTLRSSSVPRTVPDLDSSRYVRGTSMPPNAYYSDSHSPYVASCFYSSRRNVASPFADRALSVPPSTYTSGFSSSSSTSSSHYSDF